MDDDFDDFADEFFDEAALALADQVEQKHISLTQQPPKPTQSNRHALAMPARSVRTVGLTKGLAAGHPNEIAARARTGQPAATSTSNLAPRPVGGGQQRASAQFKPPTIKAKSPAFEEQEYYPDVVVNESGFYNVIRPENAGERVGAGGGGGSTTAAVSRNKAESSAGPYQRPPNAANRAAGALATGGQKEGPTLGDRKPISRSISMGPSQSASHPQSHFHPPARTRNPSITSLASRQNAVAGPSGSQAGAGYRPPASQGPAGSQGPPSSFKRTNSIGETARRLAINRAMGMLPDLKEEVVAKERDGVGRETSHDSSDAMQVDGVDEGNSVETARSVAVQDDRYAEAEGSAQALREAMEKMKQRMEQLEKDKADAEKKAKAAQADVWKYQGEAKIIRGKFEEKEKAHETLAESMKKKMDVMQETLAKQSAEHQRDIEGMNTVNAFKTHNLLTSTSKAGRFPSTQRSALRNGSSTPSRQQSAFPQGTPSRSPGKQAFNRSPSKLGMVRSPVRMGGPGAMLPPPAPVFNDGFKTPNRAQTASKKAGKATERDETESAPAAVGFSNIAQSFNVNSVPRMNKKQKVKHDDPTMVQQDGSPRSSSPILDDNNAGIEMIWEPVEDRACSRVEPGRDSGKTLSHESVLDQIGSAESDAWQKVVHIVLTHTWVSQSVSDPLAEMADPSGTVLTTLTLHKIMHYEQTQGGQESEDRVRKHIVGCRSILGLCGEVGGPVSTLIYEIAAGLWSVCMLFAKAQYVDTVLSLLNLLAAIFDILTEHASEEHLVGSRSECLEFLEASISFEQFLESLNAPADDAKPSAKGKEKALVTQSPPEAELVLSYLGLLADACLDCSWLPEGLVKFVASPRGVVGMLQSTALADIRHACADLIGAIIANTHPQTFRWLLSDPNANGNDPTRIPVVAALCDMITGPRSHGQSSILLLMKALAALSNLAQMDRDAAFLLGQNYHLVPAIIRTLERAADGLWGIGKDSVQIDDHMLALIPCLTLLHYLVFPPASDDPEAPAGLDLAGRLQASAGIKDLVGLHHIFVTAMGRISYAETDILDGWSEVDVRSMQDLAQDLLDIVVVGPEGDAIYEIYVSDRPAEQEEEMLDDLMPDDEEYLAHLPPDDSQDMA